MADYSSLDGERGDGLLSVPSGDSSTSSKSRLRLPRMGRGPSGALSQPLNASTVEDDVDSSDPYYVFQSDLCNKLELVDEALAEFLRVVHQTDTAVNTHELKEAKKHLKRAIKNAEPLLGDVQATIQLVEKDREKFHIDNTELYDRKALVNTSMERLNLARQEMNSEEVKRKLVVDNRAKTLRRTNNNNSNAAENGTAQQQANAEFIADSHARASMLIMQQDEALDDLDSAVVRVGHMAETIHEEIGTQNKMLEDMDADLANAEEQLGMVMGKLAKLLKTKNKCQLGTILCLLAIVIVLFLLVLYT
ncbi:Syntaxin-6 [Seminavis robusta]|uniref:Syntaxin-6 n=1 Tax=Seminavis robusta TaxID=568900 RepID=A0A9N8DGT3_9STRA|nr:Syntaxin-6 [Seminavis robusta]|eukprot:Sro151_g069210.1 Syntaxin-6 (306) ;mRNA; f:59249-60296